jgi:transcription elongation factor GreA
VVNNQTIYLTPEGQKKLEKELEHLRNVRRKEVAARLHEAMEDGELIENAEYEAAKNEQAFVEGRILELDHILAQAQVIRPEKGSDHVMIGSTVEIKEGNKKSETFKIVGAAEADPKEGLISNESPIGKALLGKKVGEIAEVDAPDGTLRFKVIKIK